MHEEFRKQAHPVLNDGRTPEQAPRDWGSQRIDMLLREMHEHGVRGTLSFSISIRLLDVLGHAMRDLSDYLRRDAGPIATLGDIVALWLIRTLPRIHHWLQQRIPWRDLWDHEPVKEPPHRAR